MSDPNFENQLSKRFYFSRLLSILYRPKQVFSEMVSEARAAWSIPMLVLSAITILTVVVAGVLKSRAAMMGEVPLPPDWQYWTPDMQNNYIQAQQATHGPTFLYIIPLVSALTSLWVGWLLLAGLLHLGSTLLGGRGTMQNALNVVAYANLPYAVRGVVRIVYMLSTGHAIVSPGLSGFSSNPGFTSQLLARLDIFLLWSIILLIIGLMTFDELSKTKAITGVMVVLLIILLAQAGLGALFSSLGGTVVQRPFY